MGGGELPQPAGPALRPLGRSRRQQGVLGPGVPGELLLSCFRVHHSAVCFAGYGACLLHTAAASPRPAAHPYMPPPVLALRLTRRRSIQLPQLPGCLHLQVVFGGITAQKEALDDLAVLQVG